MEELKVNKAHFVSSFLKDLSLYALEPIISKLFSFLLIPIYTAYLLPSEFGELNYVFAIGAFLRSFSQMGLNTAFWKFRSDSSGFEKSSVNLALTISQTYLSILVIVILIISYFTFSKNPVLTGILILYFVALSIKIVSENVLLICRANKEPKKYLRITILQTVLLFFFNYLFVVGFKWGVIGVVYGYIFTFFFIAVFYFKELIQNFKSDFNWKLSKEMIRFGFPVMLANFSLLLLSLSDRWFLKNFSSDQELGCYSYAYKFSDLIATFIVYTFQLTWTPIAWKIFDKSNGNEYFAFMKKLVYVFFPFICFVGVFAISILSKIMTVDENYLSAFNLIIYLAFSNVFYGFYLFYNTALYFKKKQKISLYCNLIVGVLTIIINFIVIPKFGMYGAAWVTFYSYLVLFFSVKIVASKSYDHPQNELLEIGLIAFMVITVNVIFIVQESMESFFLKALIPLGFGLIYLGLIQLTGFLQLNGVFNKLKALRIAIKENKE